MEDFTFMEYTLYGILLLVVAWYMFTNVSIKSGDSTTRAMEETFKISPKEAALSGVGCGMGLANLVTCIQSVFRAGPQVYDDMSWISAVNGNLSIIHRNFLALRDPNEGPDGGCVGAIIHWISNPGENRDVQIVHRCISDFLRLSEFGSIELSEHQIKTILSSQYEQWKINNPVN